MSLETIIQLVKDTAQVHRKLGEMHSVLENNLTKLQEELTKFSKTAGDIEEASRHVVAWAQRGLQTLENLNSSASVANDAITAISAFKLTTTPPLVNMSQPEATDTEMPSLPQPEPEPVAATTPTKALMKVVTAPRRKTKTSAKQDLPPSANTRVKRRKASETPAESSRSSSVQKRSASPQFGVRSQKAAQYYHSETGENPASDAF